MLSQSFNPSSKMLLATSLAVGLCGSVLGTATPSRGTVIIQDGFTSAGGYPGAHFSSAGGTGGEPTDTVPGPTGPKWQGVGQSNGYNTTEMTSAGMGNNAAGTVGWAAAANGNGGAFTLGTISATQLDISMTFGAANGTGSTTYYLGFYSNFSEGGYNGAVDHPNNGTFTGLALDTSGNLSTDNNGTLANTTAYGPGTFSVNANTTGGSSIINVKGAALYTLSYDLNLANGMLSNVSLTGDSNASSLDGVSITGNTAVTPDYAGFGVNQNNGIIGLTSFEVSSPSAIPEPAALGLMAVAGAGILLLKRRQPKHA